MHRQSICINSKNFNVDKLVVAESKEIKTNGSFKLKLADMSYLNDKDEPCDLYISLPTFETYGPFP